MLELKSAINTVTNSNIEAAPTSVCALAVLRSIEASHFRFNRRGKMVSARQLGCRRSFLDRVTATTRIQIAAKELVPFAGAGAESKGCG
jgi:hypothetical protein